MKYYEDPILGKGRAADVTGGTGGGGGTTYIAGDGIAIAGSTISATGSVSMTTTARMALTPAPGFLIWDTDLEKLFVGDGSTAGGVEIEGGGGGEGTVTGIEASVTGNTATIVATGSSTSVPFVGVGGLEISGNTNGEVELDASDKQDVIVFNSDEFEVETTPQSPSEINTFRNRLFGKVLCCCGDSITVGAQGGSTDDSKITSYSCDASGNFSLDTGSVWMSYGWRIANRNAMTYYNGGISGSTMADVTNRDGFSVTRYTKLPNNINYLLIFFGTNDSSLAPLGTITDTTNATFYGAWNVVMPYIINNHPYTKIGLIVPYKPDASIREAVRLIGNKWGCAVFDMMQAGTPLFYQKESSVDVAQDAITQNRTNYFADGTHPNSAGHELLADMIETFLYTL